MSIRELTQENIGEVSGGITGEQAGAVLAGFGSSALVGATLGAMFGPGGIVSGILIGGGRAAVTFGVGALVAGAASITAGYTDTGHSCAPLSSDS
jgi:hypothetical protein